MYTVKERSYMKKHGFTLLELMIVIAIIGILVTIGTFAFLSAQKKARDSRRKSDIDQVAKSLEMYVSDVGRYPAGTTGEGKIVGCADATGTVGTCEWGGSFSNTQKSEIYMVKLPKDPTESRTYYYERVGNGYRLYARQENTEDGDETHTEITELNPSPTPLFYDIDCSDSETKVCCNYVITSPNLALPATIETCSE